MLLLFLQKVPEKSQKVTKNANKWLKSAQKSRKVSKRRDIIVLVLLSAHAERVCVSRMLDFSDQYRLLCSTALMYQVSTCIQLGFLRLASGISSTVIGWLRS